MFLTFFTVECLSHDDSRILEYNNITTLSQREGFDLTYFNIISQIDKSEHWNDLDDSDPFRFEITTYDHLKEGIEGINNNTEIILHILPSQSDGPKTTLQKCAFINSGTYQNVWIYPFVNVYNSSDIGHYVDTYQTFLERTKISLKDEIQKKDIAPTIISISF